MEVGREGAGIGLEVEKEEEEDEGEGERGEVKFFIRNVTFHWQEPIF